jgi:hypothetical protein
MKYAWTESEPNLNCPCFEATLLVRSPFGGIDLQVSRGGQTFSPRTGRTRSGLTCGLPCVYLRTQDKQQTQAKRAEGRSVRRPCVRNDGFRSHTPLVKPSCPLGVKRRRNKHKDLVLSE